MHPIAGLIQRNVSRFTHAGRTLWINPPPDGGWAALSPACPEAGLFCQDYADYLALQAQDAPALFGDFPASREPRYETLILTLPREKQRLEMMLALAAGWMEPGGKLWLAGENRAGIKSSRSILGKYFCRVEKHDSARHCVLFCASGASRKSPPPPDDFLLHWVQDTVEPALEVCSWPGVFAHGTLDAGTRLLLEHLPEPPAHSRVLDFGCGAGLIGCFMLQRQPALEMTLCDSSALALSATRKTLDANGLAGTVLPSDGFSGINGCFDLVVSNPPFHRGYRSEVSLSQALLNPAGNFLNPGGQLIVVANRHLPYQSWLEAGFDHLDVLAVNSRYHVLSVVRPDRG